ncbi:hypothetical protein BH09GEM1_BH09GEM1_12480 [soil metagenome]
MTVRTGDDANRIRALHRYDILDSPPGQPWDDLATLAAQLCDTPIALIALVGEDRQWVKSTIGLTMSEALRDTAMCAHAILGPGLLVVPDTARDKRFADHPLVTGDTRIRFYAGAPLITPDGQALGALCVMDRKPRRLSRAQQNGLRLLSGQVMSQLEQRRTSRELAECTVQLSHGLSSCPVSVAVLRVSDQAFVDVNVAFTELFGWTREDVIGRTWVQLNMVSETVAAQLRSQLTGAASIPCNELELRTRSGAARRVLLGTHPFASPGERQVIVTFVDVVGRQQAQLASSRNASIVESSSDAILGTDLDSNITSWNEGATSLFGYQTREILGSSITRLIPVDREGEMSMTFDKTRRGEKVNNFETQRLTKDGRLIDVSVSAFPVEDSTGTVIGAYKIVRDLTASKHSAAVVAASEGRYRTLFDYAPDGILISDLDGYYVDANAAACGMLGRSKSELVGLCLSDILAATDHAGIAPLLNALRADAEYHREWQLQRGDGAVIAAEVLATRMPDGNLLAMIRDVTQRNRADARLRELVDSKLQGVLFWNTGGGISGANDLFLDIIGYTREDLETGGIGWSSLTPPEHAESTERARKAMALHGFVTPFEMEFARKDGTRVPVLVGATTFEDNPREGVAFVLDLTERKKLEQQFFRAQRMESIGTLAGGIAHDLNNVLAPIVMALDILRAELTRPDHLAMVRTMHVSALRGAELVQQVLSFARGVESQQITVNPIHIMRELLKVLRETLPKSIVVRFSPPSDLWTVNGDPSQMHQVFMNLCVNARDAMPNGGKLIVSMENMTLDDTYASMSLDAHAGDYVLVQVTDTGVGVPAAIRDRIFEPFFTTKAVGKGTGLGLSTCLAIVKSHGGFINVYSELGHGATFRVYLPANSRERVSDLVDAERTTTVLGNGVMVLVVDDEPAIRTIVRTTLERFGYRVLVASNGAEAVALYAQHRSEISVVLTDMAMPVMDGPSTIVALKSINAAVKIIASSGHSSNASVAMAVDAGVLDFVPKPYSAETLLTTLAKVLREP